MNLYDYFYKFVMQISPRQGEHLFVYSVCTFNPDETYGVIDEFLEKNGNFMLENLKFEKEYMKKEKDGYFITLGDIIYFSVIRREK